MTPVCRSPWKTICGIRSRVARRFASRVGLRDRSTQPRVGRGLRERHQRPALAVPDVSIRRRQLAAAEPQLGELVGKRGRERERLRLVALDDLPLDLPAPRLRAPEVPGDAHPAALEVEVGPLQREQLALAEQQLERGCGSAHAARASRPKPTPHRSRRCSERAARPRPAACGHGRACSSQAANSRASRARLRPPTRAGDAAARRTC